MFLWWTPRYFCRQDAESNGPRAPRRPRDLAVEKGRRKTCRFRCEGVGSLRQLENIWKWLYENIWNIQHESSLYIIVRSKWSHSLWKRVMQPISRRFNLDSIGGKPRSFVKALDVEIHRFTEQSPTTSTTGDVTMQQTIPRFTPKERNSDLLVESGPHIELSASSFNQHL